ncbi:MAG: AAA family ATPase, partial [Chloroflexi bacterium]|nr:AAA family ATPase [Chloroflexota bacterium]
MCAGTGSTGLNLRKLELSGFKTFARRTEVLLPGGVTGIVGPNGSGKSNLADALRWVLGEQSLQHVRGKKTEDVIFAGGANRPPTGMAEVVLTLDNTSGWIPLDFSEVTIGRRAYRSGENEYFINGSRVRLRDVVDLRNRAGFGQSSYSVIGQGLVDAVLSQRPEERRALFEEAAGIRHYQARRDHTLDQLEATQRNLVRVRDIVAEIEPRLDGLRRQSERARQHAELAEQLRTLQIRWFAARQRLLTRRASEAAALLAAAQRELAEAAREAAEVDARLASHDVERQRVSAEREEAHRRAAELERRRDALDGQLALAREKLAYLHARAEDAARELSELGAVVDRARAAVPRGAEAVEALQREHAAAAAELAAAQDSGALAEQAQAGLERNSNAARERVTQAVAVVERLQREQAQLAQRLAEVAREATQHEEDVARKQASAVELGHRQAELQQQ